MKIYMLPGGFFWGYKEDRLIIGKCHPLTKEVETWAYYEDKQDEVSQRQNELNKRMSKALQMEDDELDKR